MSKPEGLFLAPSPNTTFATLRFSIIFSANSNPAAVSLTLHGLLHFTMSSFLTNSVLVLQAVYHCPAPVWNKNKVILVLFTASSALTVQENILMLIMGH